MKIPAQDRSRRTLNRIMAAAVESFTDVGVDNATVAEIVRAAKSSVGSFYGRFSSKDDLVIAIDVLLWSEVDDRWRSSIYDLAGVPAGGADPLSDTVTDLSIAIDSRGGPTMRQLSEAVFQALGPELVARTRVSAYLERNGRPTEGTRIMTTVRTDVLRTLKGAEVDSGLAGFLAGVILRAAVDPDGGDNAVDHLSHVLAASLGGSTKAFRAPTPSRAPTAGLGATHSRPTEPREGPQVRSLLSPTPLSTPAPPATPAAVPVTSPVPSTAPTPYAPPAVTSPDPAPSVSTRPVEQPPTPTPLEADTDASSDDEDSEPPKPEAFDIWA